MKIIFKVNDFFHSLFPEAKGLGSGGLESYLKDFYSKKQHSAKVGIEGDLITIDTKSPIQNPEANPDFRNALAFCQRGGYRKALPILKKHIKKIPFNSEAHRVLGQIESDMGNQDKAVEHLLESLRWNPRNTYALVMLGNIYSKFRNDVATGMKYFDMALETNPKDHITINNIGGSLLQSGEMKKAKDCFRQALKINDKYPHTHYALGMVSLIENDLLEAFESTVLAIKLNARKDHLFNACMEQLFEIAGKVINNEAGNTIVDMYKRKLEEVSGTRIVVVADETIPTAAKIEFAENYGRDVHTVRFKPQYPAVQHLIMHELVHLDFTVQARKQGVNKLFISGSDHRARFARDLENDLERFEKMGMTGDSIREYVSSVFDGINRQISSTPVDLLIETFLYNEYPELRPYQFHSLSNLNQEGLRAVTNRDSVRLSPSRVMFLSKVYNMLNASLLSDLYGVDLVKEFDPTPRETKIVESLFGQYKLYVATREPGEEYELIMHWARELGADKYFELVDEQEYRKSNNMTRAQVSDKGAEDPLNDEAKAGKHRTFLEHHEGAGLNMAVVMFMVEALEFFENMTADDIKVIAFEIALKGTRGYSPDKDNYETVSMPGRVFSGYQILSYYYVSWALVMPEMLPKLQLPFDDEYARARSLFSSGQKE